MTRLRWGFPAVLLAASTVASGQAASAPVQASAAQQHPAAAAPVSATSSSKTAAAAVAAASPEQQRLLDEADQLLDLAQKLKAEVDKSDQYTLSLNTLRRADDIEKLAKNLEKQVPRDGH